MNSRNVVWGFFQVLFFWHLVPDLEDAWPS